MNERQILADLNNPFLVNMYYAFQDRESLYLVMDYLSGGDLRYHICKHRKFTEEQTRKKIPLLPMILDRVHLRVPLVHAPQEHYSPRHQARKQRYRPRRYLFFTFRLPQSHRLRYRPYLASRKLPGYLWHPRVHGARGHVSPEPWH